MFAKPRPHWRKETLPNQQALALGASMSGSLSALECLCRTTKKDNKFCATNIAIKKTPATSDKLNRSLLYNFHTAAIHIFVALLRLEIAGNEAIP